LLPGSRKQEIERCLPPMLETAKLLPTHQFVIAGMKHTQPWLGRHSLPGNVKAVFDKTYDLLAHSDAALVTSGTATLEAALLNVPQVCAYRTSPLTYFIARQLVKVPFISLVNLVAGKRVIPELIQSDMQPSTLFAWLQDILPGGPKRDAMLADYTSVREALKGSGASQRAAQVVVDFVGASKP
jgi:lipid-A-disaccharide synthase